MQEPNRILDRILFLCRILQDPVQDFYQGYDEIREKLQGQGRKAVGWGVQNERQGLKGSSVKKGVDGRNGERKGKRRKERERNRERERERERGREGGREGGRGREGEGGRKEGRKEGRKSTT